MQINGKELASQLIASEAASIKAQNQIQMAVAKKQLDAQKSQGQAMVELIQSISETPGRGIDARA